MPQVLGEPGVWSALSFLGGNAAGKRSTDETQVSWIIQLSTVYYYYYFFCYYYYYYYY